jgi:putative drug exporter of the RND superfamily
VGTAPARAPPPAEVTVFIRWGAFVYRRRRIVALVMVAIAILSLPFALRAPGELRAGGWLDPGSESAAVSDRLAAEFGTGKSSLIVLFRSDAAGADATSPEFQQAIASTMAGVAGDPEVEGVVGYAETGDARFISTDGTSAYVLLDLAVDDEGSVAIYPDLRAKLVAPAGYSILVSGYAPLTIDSTKQQEKDLQRGESLAIPITIVILIAVFASIVAAGMPLLVALLAIPTSLMLVFWVAQSIQMADYTLNIATMLGLALAIDYSLFIVSRFREELARGRTVEQATEKAVGTSGKAVLFSGIAVAIGLSGLVVFPFPAIRSIGLGAAIVVACSVLFALTFLPAMLGMLGPRVNALSIEGLIRRLRLGSGHEDVPPTEQEMERSRWERVAKGVMAHPIAVLVPVLAVLLVLGSPFLRLEQGVPGADSLPAGLESREAYLAIQVEYEPGSTTPTTILADVTGDPTSPENIAAISAYADRIVAVEGVTRVESPFTFVDPATGRQVPLAQVQQAYAAPEAQRPSFVNALLGQYVRGSTVKLDVITPYNPSSRQATDLVPVIRDVPAGDGMTTAVGGGAALAADFLQGEARLLPFAIAWTMLATMVILFLLFGSIAIPIKAVLMTLLSVTASFGALVWIFQEGHLEGLLDFQSLGYTIAGLPIIMFCIIFGLSMDYEVLLLSRIQEAYRRTGDNTTAVAEGLVRTARVITGAALVMVSVFLAFALAESVAIKSVGVGMAIAVLIDATIVRVLLVPATMRLLGKWNWWAPGPLKHLADRIGFDHIEDLPDEELTEPAAGATGATAGA